MCGCGVCLWVGLGRVLIVVIACAHTYKTLARFFSCMQVVELANAWSQDKDCLFMSPWARKGLASAKKPARKEILATPLGTMKFYKGSPLMCGCADCVLIGGLDQPAST